MNQFTSNRQRHLAGMRRTEAIAMLENKHANYLQHPIVNIHIENFKITVLGEVNHPRHSKFLMNE